MASETAMARRAPPAPVLASLLAAAGLLCAGLGAAPVQAVPPNPERPFDATSCAEALARYREALAGSPLISAEERARVLEAARAQVLRLCGPEVDPGALDRARPAVMTGR